MCYSLWAKETVRFFLKAVLIDNLSHTEKSLCWKKSEIFILILTSIKYTRINFSQKKISVVTILQMYWGIKK